MPTANPEFVQPSIDRRVLNSWSDKVLNKSYMEFTPDDWIKLLRSCYWNANNKAFMVSMHHRAKADWFLLNGKWVRKH